MPRVNDAIPLARTSRRTFLATAALSAAAVGGPPAWPAPRPATAAQVPHSQITTVSEHVLVYHGPINVGIIRQEDRALVIDCGDASVRDALQQLGITQVEQLLFTHYHRDQSCGAAEIADGAATGVPAAERDLFANPAEYWNDDRQLDRVYQSFRPDHLTPTEPLAVARTLADGDRVEFGPASIRVLSTPGHTDGSISFLVEADGRRTVFSGDCLAGPGQLWDLWSLQRGFAHGGQEIGGYHGFLGDRWRLADSLRKIRAARPDLLVPAHGVLMEDPDSAIDSVLAELERCYENYVSISALRHYFPQLFADYAGRPGQMPIRPGEPPPACLHHFGTTWILVSRTGHALVMDVGSPAVVDQLQQLLRDGKIRHIDGLWVTHDHFDHTDGIVAFQQAFDCPCYTDAMLADVLVRPTAWRLPCLAPEAIRVDHPLRDGQQWAWHEFTLTACHFPGQTLYHSGLLAAADDLRLLFVGDSHTMSGLDDYCAYNRNWLGRDVGFHRCLTLIEQLKPTHMFNCHVDDAFTFTAEEIQFMREKLDQREQLFGQLVPWDHANFGTDPLWVRTDPYRQSARPGDTVHAQVVITNHAAQPVRASCRAVLPTTLGGGATDWVEQDLPAKAERAGRLSFSVPASAAPGRHVVPVDVRYHDRSLPRFSELLVDVV